MKIDFYNFNSSIFLGGTTNMIESKKLKKGMLVWWTATRHSSDWDCPCVVTKVDRRKNSFRVISFDTMKETDDLLINRPEGDDKSSLTEMRQINVEEVEDYFELRKGQLQEQIDRAQVELSKKQHELETYKQRSLEALQKIRVGKISEQP